MSIPIPIEKLLDGDVVEQARIEYKAGWNPEDILHTLCAFANDIDNWGGGYIVIGVEERDGLPVKPVRGLPTDSLDRHQKALLSLCHKTQPIYMPVCSPVTYEGKSLLMIWAPGGYERPYQAWESLGDKKTTMAYYIRRFSSTVKATKADIKELHDLGGNIPFDDRINHHASMSDLRHGRMVDYLESVGSSLAQGDHMPGELAEALKVAGGPREDVRPINVGLMFFGDDPSDFFREARIDVVDIPDPTGEGMTERTFNGPLDRQLIDALAFIRNNVIAGKVFKVPDRAEAIRVNNYPYPAIEEALSNAVYHKSYQTPEPITVRVESDRLIINSCPGPDRSISDEDLRNRHLRAKRYRNRRVGDFLKELHLVEGRNTGVPTMLRACQENGSEPPLFETDEERSFFSVTYMVHPSFLDERRVERPLEELRKGAGRRRSPEELRSEIVSLLTADSLSKNELARELGYSGVPKNLTATINALLDEGVVGYTTENGNSPYAKLRLL